MTAAVGRADAVAALARAREAFAAWDQIHGGPEACDFLYALVLAAR